MFYGPWSENKVLLLLFIIVIIIGETCRRDGYIIQWIDFDCCIKCLYLLTLSKFLWTQRWMYLFVNCVASWRLDTWSMWVACLSGLASVGRRHDQTGTSSGPIITPSVTKSCNCILWSLVSGWVQSHLVWWMILIYHMALGWIGFFISIIRCSCCLPVVNQLMSIIERGTAVFKPIYSVVFYKLFTGIDILSNSPVILWITQQEWYMSLSGWEII